MEKGDVYEPITGYGERFELLFETDEFVAIQSLRDGSVLDISKIFFRNNYRLVEGTKMEEKGKVRKAKRNEEYTFTVSSDKLIDFVEIESTLTRKNPVAIVHRSDGFHTVFVHNCVWVKASQCGLLNELTDAVKPYNTATWLPLDSKILSPLMATVKKVRRAKVNSGTRIECKVELIEV